MKPVNAVISLAVLATGTAGAAVAYVSAAPRSSADQSVSAPAPAAPKAAPRAVPARPRVKVEVRFRTCRPGASLEHGKCVRHVVHTVVVPAPAPPAPAVTTASPPAPAGGSQQPSGGHRSANRPRPAASGAGSPQDHGSTEPSEPGDD